MKTPNLTISSGVRHFTLGVAADGARKSLGLPLRKRCVISIKPLGTNIGPQVNVAARRGRANEAERGHWKTPASSASAPSVRTAPRPSFAATEALLLRVVARRSTGLGCMCSV